MKKFLKKIAMMFKILLMGVDRVVIQNVDDAIDAVNALKGIVQSNIVQAFIRFTPTSADNEFVSKLTGWMDKALQILLKYEPCSKIQDQQERFKCCIAQLKNMSPDLQNGAWLQIASLIIQQQYPEMTAKEINTIIQGRLYDKTT